MKKIIIAAAIILTTGMLTTITKNNSTKTISVTKTAIELDHSVLGTAD
jgi:hypothetical protein